MNVFLLLSLLVAVFLILVYALGTLFTDPAESRQRTFTERFSAEYPGAHVVEEFLQARIIRRDNKFFKVTLNEREEFVEEPL